ncbi:MAG: PHP domain-containing protein [Chitinispirillaceae bacterium]|nr:PHP domain-containing protein [Chitinispirillaceae bacterium]
MIAVDFHVHSIFSLCGLHTVLELLERARKIGMRGFAVTDHGPTIGGRLNSVFFERFISPDPHVSILKGIECNLLDREGAIDLPGEYLRFLDIVLLGIHPNFPKGLDRQAYTEMMLAALRRNPMVDIVTHPNDATYPVDYEALAEASAAAGVALELNNSKIRYPRSTPAEAVALLTACKDTRCRIAVNSDTHAIHELGDDAAVAPLLRQVDFPQELIVNRTASAAFDFVEERRSSKR